MKKGGLLTFFLAIALVFCAGQFVSAATIGVTFSGPYDAVDLLRLGLDRDDVVAVNALPICQTEDLTYGFELPDLDLLDPTLPAGSKSYLFYNPEPDGYADFEVWTTAAHTLNESTYEGPWVNAWWTQVSTTDPGYGATSYLHFSGGTLQGLKYYDITFIPEASGTWNDTDINVHPTPIPSALLLLGSGFVGLVGLRRFRRK